MQPGRAGGDWDLPVVLAGRGEPVRVDSGQWSLRLASRSDIKPPRGPRHHCPLVTMKAVVLTLLAIGLILQPSETSPSPGQGHGNRAGVGAIQGDRGALRESTHPEGQRERRWRKGTGSREVRWKEAEAAAGRRDFCPCPRPPLGRLAVQPGWSNGSPRAGRARGGSSPDRRAQGLALGGQTDKGGTESLQSREEVQGQKASS